MKTKQLHTSHKVTQDLLVNVDQSRSLKEPLSNIQIVSEHSFFVSLNMKKTKLGFKGKEWTGV